ncbi:hypothetical protein C1645_756186 [Glomus cerebriforme]|uniref:CsbD-like domain-containing protein n=1 Tax=Glomus cerebriforme TaxID=658196 RepID=A0A397THQ2_9GLOM|nr:hypothetical protein C1645_756186 [Glomus cerebriforme]
MPEHKASKLRGDLKYYEGSAKEYIGNLFNNENLKKKGEADKLTGASERETALVRQGIKKGNDLTIPCLEIWF